MSTVPTFHEAMGMPKYLLAEHVDIVPEGETPPWKPAYRTIPPESFYRNDEHITAAVIWLHPLLDNAGLEVFSTKRRAAQEVDELFELDEITPEARVHLLISGRMRLVAYPKNGLPFEIGQCRPGQWIGMPSALREFDEEDDTMRWTRPASMVIKAIPLGKVTAESVLVSDLVTAMHKSRTLLRYVRHHVSIRFARRKAMFDCLKQNTILRLLSPADQEYLLQLGAVRRVHHSTKSDDPSVHYMTAGKPSERVALMLEGSSSSIIPGDPGRFAGQFESPHLVGHEAIVMPEEMKDIHCNVHPVEAPRATDIYVAPGSEVLEFYWYAFRWTLDDRLSVWNRIATKLTHLRHGGKIPEIISIQASRPRLGTSALTTGLATALADLLHDNVCIVDLQGQQRFDEYYQPRGFTYVKKTGDIQMASRAARKEGLGKIQVEYCQLVGPQDLKPQMHWPSRVEVVWPDGNQSEAEAVGTVENLVELLYSRDDLRYIIVCMRQTAQDSAAKHLADLLNSRSLTILYVTDETEAGYQFNSVPPRRLVWVERMTEEYKKREHQRMEQAMNQARYGECVDLLPDGPRETITNALGGFPDEKSNTDFILRRQIVRVPDDVHGMALFDKLGPYAVVGPGAPNLPLKRALSRLARVVTRRTVGLALGGGGAWGYSHLALIQNLEEQGVPIDYITGASFGSIVGGLYVAGGMAALERLLEENSLNADSPASALLAPLTSPLMRTVMFAGISAASIEWFVNSQLRRMGINQGELIGLGTTEIPFYPIGSNLTTHRERTEEHATVGHGVRLSGTMPPVAPAFRLNGELIVDGAFVANVPSRYLRAIGADFVIAANAVPPSPAERPEGGAIKKTINFFMTRFNDAMAANQLLTWKAGEDQANLHADYRVDMRPKDASVFDMWKGRAIVDQIRRDHFTGAKATAIRDAWLKFCYDPSARIERDVTTDVGDGVVGADARRS